jgi:hypothetical protein
VLEEGGTVAGRILGPGRKPLEGVRVSVGAGRFGLVRTGPDGEYEVSGVPPGRHVINPLLRGLSGISDPIGVPVEPQAFDENGLLPVVVLEEPGDRVRQDFRVVPGGRVCVRVADPKGEPLEVERLAVFRSGDEKPYRTQYGYSADRRDEPDRLCARSVPPGRLAVQASSRSFVDVWWPGEEERALATEVELEPGKTVEIGPMIARPAGIVRITLPERFVNDVVLKADLLPAIATKEPTVPCSAVSEDGAEEWIALPRERIEPKRDRDDEAGDDDGWRFREVRIEDVPEGAWWLRICMGKDGCDDRDDFCSKGVVSVKRGATTETDAVTLADDLRMELDEE